MTSRLGRPLKKPKRGARNPLGLRVTAELKNKLDRAAALSGRSQSQEAELRLEHSFQREQTFDQFLEAMFGSKEIASLMVALAQLRHGVERLTGKSIETDKETVQIWTHAMARWVEGFYPKGAGQDVTRLGRADDPTLRTVVAQSNFAEWAAEDRAALMEKYLPLLKEQR
jgi:hypothetical protein